MKATFSKNGCNRPLGTTRVLVNPGEFSGTAVGYFPVGGWVPTVGLLYAQAAMVWAGLGGASDNVDTQLAMRTAIVWMHRGECVDRISALLFTEAGWSVPPVGSKPREVRTLVL